MTFWQAILAQVASAQGECAFGLSFAPRSAVVSCHARDGVSWMCPVDGSRSFEARAQEPPGGQGRLHSIVASREDSVRTFHSDHPGRKQAPRSPQSTACSLFGKPADFGKPQQSTPWR